MSTEYFPFGKIKYDGPTTRYPFAYRWYDKTRIVQGKSMEEWLKPTVAMWHSVCSGLSDQFGGPSRTLPWNAGVDEMTAARQRTLALFELVEKLGFFGYAFHDYDAAPRGKNHIETCRNLDEVVKIMKAEQERIGVKCLWGTANMFSEAIFANGAATSPNPDAFALAAARVKKMLEVELELGALGHVFWGGREGYWFLPNTDMRRERDHYARLLHLSDEYMALIHWLGLKLIEPKPFEPTMHQYDSHAAACHAFLQYEDLDGYYLNIEGNHAELAGLTLFHELTYAAAYDLLGGVDANQGQPMRGWDTDEFPADAMQCALGMHVILQAGGLKGGFNFDAHTSRCSFQLDDLAFAHILGVDTLALGLLIADAMIKDGALTSVLKQRYAGWDDNIIGQSIESGKTDFTNLERYVKDKEAHGGLAPNESGREEMLKTVLRDYYHQVVRNGC